MKEGRKGPGGTQEMRKREEKEGNKSRKETRSFARANNENNKRKIIKNKTNKGENAAHKTASVCVFPCLLLRPCFPLFFSTFSSLYTCTCVVACHLESSSKVKANTGEKKKRKKKLLKNTKSFSLVHLQRCCLST